MGGGGGGGREGEGEGVGVGMEGETYSPTSNTVNYKPHNFYNYYCTQPPSLSYCTCFFIIQQTASTVAANSL